MATRGAATFAGHGIASFIGGGHDLPTHVELARDHGPVYDRLHEPVIMGSTLE